MKDSTKKFIEVWWRAESIHDVIAYLKTIPKFADKPDNKLANYSNSQASKLRKMDIPLKYMSGLKRGITLEEVDPREALDFIKSLGVTQEEIRLAKQEQKQKLQEFEKRQKAAAQSGKQLGRRKRDT